MAQRSSDDRRDARYQDESAPAPAAGPVEAEALDAVIRATLDTADSPTATLAEIEALRDVARRWDRTPPSFDPVAVDLVEAILLVNYGALPRPKEVWRGIAEKIAKQLTESPAARARLENLWQRLVEANAAP